jgi:hypothetical protein
VYRLKRGEESRGPPSKTGKLDNFNRIPSNDSISFSSVCLLSRCLNKWKLPLSNLPETLVDHQTIFISGEMQVIAGILPLGMKTDAVTWVSKFKQYLLFAKQASIAPEGKWDDIYITQAVTCFLKKGVNKAGEHFLSLKDVLDIINFDNDNAGENGVSMTKLPSVLAWDADKAMPETDKADKCQVLQEAGVLRAVFHSLRTLQKADDAVSIKVPPALLDFAKASRWTVEMKREATGPSGETNRNSSNLAIGLSHLSVILENTQVAPSAVATNPKLLEAVSYMVKPVLTKQNRYDVTRAMWIRIIKKEPVVNTNQTRVFTELIENFLPYVMEHTSTQLMIADLVKLRKER